MDFIIPTQVYGTAAGIPIPTQPTRIRSTFPVGGPGATQILAADLARRGAVIKNTAAPGTGCIIGDATIAWAGIAFLDGGESVTVTGTEAVFADSAAGVQLAVIEELV